MLARWDGRRRYANLRKLARLARSYEELRGPDIEGFVRFVREQDAAGVKELEAVAEEEGAGAVRLLTIHAAKGLEFKVVVVADAGRDRPKPSGEEIICLPDGRFGFKVVDPATGKRKPAFAYDEVRDAEEAAEEAERLRLYYVAMTRAIDKLIVAGSVDSREAATRGPRSAGCSSASRSESSEDGELVRDERAARAARRPLRAREPEVAAEPAAEPGQLSLFDGRGRRPGADRAGAAAARADRRAAGAGAAAVLQRARAVRALPVPLLRGTAGRAAPRGRLRCGNRVADEPAGLPRARSATRCTGSSSGSTWARPRRRHLTRCSPGIRRRAPRSWSGSACSSTRSAGRRSRTGSRRWTTSPRSARSRSSTTACSSTASSTSSTSTAAARSSPTSSRTGSASTTPAEIVEAEYRLQRLVYALACFRAGAEEAEVVYQFLERPDDLVEATFTRDQMPELEAELSAAIERIQAGRFPPRPSEFACAGCPALDVVCAGPNLR